MYEWEKQELGKGSSFPKQPVRVPLAHPPAHVIRARSAWKASPFLEQLSVPFLTQVRRIRFALRLDGLIMRGALTADIQIKVSRRCSVAVAAPQACAARSRRRCVEMSV